LDAPNEFLKKACFRTLDEVNGCPVYSFRVLPAEADNIDTAFAQFIDISHGGDPSACSDALVAGLTLGGRWQILEATRTELAQDGVFVAEGTYDGTSGAMGGFTLIMSSDLSASIR